MIVLTFDRSSACAESHSDDTISYVETSFKTELDDSEGPWVQLTYESIRTQDGGFFAANVNGCWWVDVHGTSEPFSDVVIEFKPN